MYQQKKCLQTYLLRHSLIRPWLNFELNWVFCQGNNVLLRGSVSATRHLHLVIIPPLVHSISLLFFIHSYIHSYHYYVNRHILECLFVFSL